MPVVMANRNRANPLPHHTGVDFRTGYKVDTIHPKDRRSSGISVDTNVITPNRIPLAEGCLPASDNGTVIRAVEFPPLSPDTEAKLDPNFMMKVVGDHAPARGLPVKHPLMHRTRTVDYAIIISGEIDMRLDDKVVHVKAGDVVVQLALIMRGSTAARSRAASFLC
jgi:mannose-6-phosphate isomerase-like protein (cupin superfamily)